MPRKIGVIDIGTNSVKLAVGTVKRGRASLDYTAREPVRLGRGLASSGAINAAALRRAAAATSRLARAARQHGASEIVAVGTYALRTATNGRAVAREISRHAGVPVRILSGVQESATVLRSAQSRIPRAYRRLLVIDIGGGSAEVIVVNPARPTLSRSVPLGAVRLTEMFLRSNPVTDDQYARLNAHIGRTLARLFARVDNGGFHVVVSGGTATTAAAMLGRAARPGGAAVRTKALRVLERRCLVATLAQRRRLRGLPADRADIILAGLAVLLAFLDCVRAPSVRLIEGGVRDGIMLATAEKERQGPRRKPTRARPKAAARKRR